MTSKAKTGVLSNYLKKRNAPFSEKKPARLGDMFFYTKVHTNFSVMIAKPKF